MRRRSAKPGQIGRFWLSKRPGSPFWHRTWFDPGTRQTRRASLDRPGIDASDFEQAHLELAAYVLEQERPKDAAPAGVSLAVVLAGYWTGHASTLPSGDDARACIKRFNEFWPGKMLSEITIAEQDRYIAAREGAGVSRSRIAREMVWLRAAPRHAMKKGELAAAPFIKYAETAEDQRNDEPFGRPLSLIEVAALFNAAKTARTRRMLMILANTLCRPGAALELTRFQVDFEHRLVSLNPPGRKQTKKYRPVVPMTEALRPWLAAPQTKKYRPVVPMTEALRPWLAAPQADRYMAYGAQKVTSFKNTWRRLRRGAGLDGAVNGYSLRHTLSRELRKRRVPGEQIELMLGHARPDKTTQIYAPYDPDYCRDAAAAIDAYMRELQKLVRFPIIGPQVAAEAAAEGA